MPEIAERGCGEGGEGVEEDETRLADFRFEQRPHLVEDDHVEAEVDDAAVGEGISEAAPPFTFIDHLRPELSTCMKKQSDVWIQNRRRSLAGQYPLCDHQGEQDQVGEDDRTGYRDPGLLQVAAKKAAQVALPAAQPPLPLDAVKAEVCQISGCCQRKLLPGAGCQQLSQKMSDRASLEAPVAKGRSLSILAGSGRR
jgi:hypothetical protein